MIYEDGELSYLCQRVMFNYIKDWPECYFDTLKIRLPEGAVFANSEGEICITDYENFTLTKATVESIYNSTYEH